jgi:two-component system, NarL family, nitrate/nitrite response regulator NarL
MVTAKRPGSGHPSSNGSLTVAVIGHLRFYRESLVRSLGRHRQLIAVDLGVGDQDSLERLAHLHPEVALVDLPAASVVQAIRQLAVSTPGSRIIALAPEDSEAEILSLLEAGIAGFVPSGASEGDLVRAIEEAMRGELQLPPRITTALVTRLRTTASGRSDGSSARLTARESEIVGLVEQGLTNKEIADRLSIGVGTVKCHVHGVLHKLSVHSRHDAVVQARDGKHPLWLLQVPKKKAT